MSPKPKTPDAEAYFALIDSGHNAETSLRRAGYRVKTPNAVRAMASKLNARRAPAQNAPLPPAPVAAEEEYETDPEQIRIWNHFLCREASGLISDTRHPLYGQPHPEGWTWESAMAETKRREASGDAPGWIGPKPTAPPKPEPLPPDQWIERQLAAGGNTAPSAYWDYVEGLTPKTPPAPVLKVSTVCPPRDPVSVGSDIGSWPQVDGPGLPPNCPDASGLSEDYLRGLAETAFQDSPVERGEWTAATGFVSDSDRKEMEFKIRHPDLEESW